MTNIKQIISSVITKSLKSNNVINIKALRKNSRPYMIIWIIYYAWVIAFTTWWTASPITDEVFGEELRSLLHSVNLLSSGIFVFFIRKEWFVKTARIGALLLVMGMGSFIMFINPTIQLSSAIMIGITLGIVNISILIPFVFSLNNTEKFYSIVGSNLLINLILIFQYGNIEKEELVNKERLFSLAILLIALSATLFFNKECIARKVQEKEEKIPELKPRIYLTLVYNCAVAILCKGASKGIFNVTAQVYGNKVQIWYYLGGLAGCLIYIAVYAFSKKAVFWLINLTFSTIALGLMCNAFITTVPQMTVYFAIFLGIGGTIGMVNMYYILAVVGKKYNSIRYVRLSILFIGICGGVSGVAVGNLIYHSNTFEVSFVASFIAMAFMFIFTILSPTLSQTEHFNDWAVDSTKMEIDNEQPNAFKPYGLSKREEEVCRLLLEGFTLRQISAMLSLAYPTVNTYCTTAYRKLNINSRTELIILFKDQVRNSSNINHKASH